MMLELKNIYKNYTQGKMDVPVLKDISLSVDEGEYVAIMGPSGSGKTTLMNIIGCLDSPTSGEYILEGKDIAQSSDNKLSDVRLHSIGFVFQSFYLLSRQSALENVALPLLYAGVRRKERLEIARKALERVGLGDRVNFKPTQLSGGQCQRVAIARAIVNNPKVLLADEPTGALDTKSGEQIMEIFQKLNEEGVTIVMITHEPEIAAHAKRVLPHPRRHAAGGPGLWHHPRRGRPCDRGNPRAQRAPAAGRHPGAGVPHRPQEAAGGPPGCPARWRKEARGGPCRPGAGSPPCGAPAPQARHFGGLLHPPAGGFARRQARGQSRPSAGAAADHGPARGGAQARSPAKTCPRPPACQAPRRGGGAQAAQPGRLCHTYPHRFGGLLPTAQARPLCRAEALGAPHGVLSAGA